MKRTSLTFRLDEERRAALDRLAEATGHDRAALLEEAVVAYLENHDWHSRHIAECLRQAEAGEFASDEEVARALGRERA